MLEYFTECKPEQIPKEKNKNADTLARLASVTDSELGRLILVKLLCEPSTNAPEQILTIQSGDYWMTPIIKYLKSDGLLDN